MSDNTDLLSKAISAVDAVKNDKSSQDPRDDVAGEFYVAQILSKYATKRFETAKYKLNNEYLAETIDKQKLNASKNGMGSEQIFPGENYNITVKTNAPVQAIDATALTNSLVKQGVSQVIIDKALAEGKKTHSPATTVSVSEAK